MTCEALLEGVVIPVDKPRQWTSFQAVNKVKACIRQQYGIKKFKIGHAGTLDPLATGLLLVCVGRATKEIEKLQDGVKVYTGTMVLGATTPCFDMERTIDAYHPYEHITCESIEKARRQFVGDIEQVPPIFSAVKIAGQRAYHLARQQSPEDNATSPAPTPKTVHIHSFEITAFREGNAQYRPDSPATNATSHQTNLYQHPEGFIPEHLPQVDFRIQCGKGTYIRSIARDFGMALGSGAFLSALRREQVGVYNVAQAYNIETLAQSFFNK